MSIQDGQPALVGRYVMAELLFLEKFGWPVHDLGPLLGVAAAVVTPSEGAAYLLGAVGIPSMLAAPPIR
jgi:hypothetical protein